MMMIMMMMMMILRRRMTDDDAQFSYLIPRTARAVSIKMSQGQAPASLVQLATTVERPQGVPKLAPVVSTPWEGLTSARTVLWGTPVWTRPLALCPAVMVTTPPMLVGLLFAMFGF